MADKIVRMWASDNTPIDLLLVDNGDSTYSIGISSAGGGGDPTTIAGPLGSRVAAQSVSVALSSDGPFATNFGVQADTHATTDAGTFSFIALFKRLLEKFTTQLPAALGVGTLAQSLATNESSATLYAGTLATSGSAAALTTTQAVREVVVQNDPDNTTDVLIGNASAQPIQLKPGWSITIPVTDLATVFAKSVSGTPLVNYLGRS